MEDYAGNAKKNREQVPDKKITRVINSEVIVQKKSLGRKFKDLFVEADFRSVVRYVISDVLIPAARNMIVDASTKGVERMMYGETNVRRRGYSVGPHITYNSPINRGIPRQAPMQRYGAGTSRLNNDNIILPSREEAELVLERLNDVIDTYEVVSVADLNQLVGLPTTHVDNKWGWIYLGDVAVRQVREGYLIELPPAEALQ